MVSPQPVPWDGCRDFECLNHWRQGLLQDGTKARSGSSPKRKTVPALKGCPNQTTLGADLAEMSSQHGGMYFHLLEGDMDWNSHSLYQKRTHTGGELSFRPE